jgi:hypothetical protein
MSANNIHLKTLNRVGGHEATDDNGAAVVDVPHHGLTDRIAAIADDGVLGHLK